MLEQLDINLMLEQFIGEFCRGFRSQHTKHTVVFENNFIWNDVEAISPETCARST